MRIAPLLLAATSIAVSATATIRDARACGGCFTGPTESTQVTGHRMVLAVSQQQTTLWDQIQYAGDPAEFAWVLPIKGQVEIDVSSDLLFSVLEAQTAVTITAPNPCPPPPPQFCGTGYAATNASAAGTGTGGGVVVIAQEVVGPYETVQLSSQDPTALATWLDDHGYTVPPDIQPLIATYIDEGFDFIALRLVPGAGIQAMKPVRVTSPGAGFSLPLRMVAAGSGATVPLALWVIGEARYAPQNMPSFEITANQLVWDYATQSSNYTTLRAAGFAASGNRAWITSFSDTIYGGFFQLVDAATYDPSGSGYGGVDGTGALEAAEADVAHLLAGIPGSTPWVTALYGELSREALDGDLDLTVTTQGPVFSQYFVSNTVNAPMCPPPPPPRDCGTSSSGGGKGKSTGSGVLSGLFEDDGAGGGSRNGGSGLAGGGCTVGPFDDTRPSLVWWALAAAGAVIVRRRRA